MFARLFNGRLQRAPRAAVLALFAAVTISACETVSTGGPLPDRSGAATQETRDDREATRDRVLTPPHRASEANQLVRVGLLLPFSGPDADFRQEAVSMLNAAQLALFQTDAQRIVLIPKDTGGTVEGAARQAREVLREGADVILGPVFAGEVRAAVDEANVYGVPVVGFSTDRSVVETGAYLLSVTPEEEVARVISYASRQGLITFATLSPDDAYGLRIRDAAEAAARDNGGFLVTWETYPAGGDSTLIEQAARRLARFDAREAARNAGQEDTFELPYDAVILPEGGVGLLQLAPLLPYYDVDPRIVRFMGTGLWRDPETAREPSLAGGWFPGPDEPAHASFASAYRRSFGSEPTRLAPLAYDGVLAIASLTRGLGANGLTDQGFQRPAGFRGADGLFRFGADRIAQHALAVYQIENGTFVVIEPAPNSFEPAVF